MAKQLVEFSTKDGSSICVEVNDEERTTGVAGRDGVLGKAQQTFEDAIGRVRPIAEAVLEGLSGLANTPDQVAVEFGIKLSAKAGVVLVSSDAEANLKVSLTWKKSQVS